jgi:hypothetical protein
VAADDGGELGGPRLDGGQRGDRVDGLGGPLLAVQRPAADDSKGLGRVREGQAGGHGGGDLHGAPLRAPMAPLAGGMSDRDLAPGQLSELGVHGVRGDHSPGHADVVQQGGEHGDLVRFRLHVHPSQDRAMSVIERGQQMPAGTAGQP